MYYWRGTVCVQGGPGVADTNGPGGPVFRSLMVRGGTIYPGDGRSGGTANEGDRQ